MKCLYLNDDCEKPMIAALILSLDYLSTNVKMDNVISIESPAQGRLQSDFFQYSMYPSAEAYLTPFAMLHDVIVHLAGCPSTCNVQILQVRLDSTWQASSN